MVILTTIFVIAAFLYVLSIFVGTLLCIKDGDNSPSQKLAFAGSLISIVACVLSLVVIHA